MDAAGINAKIYAGRGKAALRLGYLFDVYRPTDPETPLSNKIDTLNAAFNAADNRYRLPSLYGKPIWFADVDGSRLHPGDYLVRTDKADEIYFIAAMQSLLPIVAIDCERTVRISSPAMADAIGAVGYSGICDADGDATDVLGRDGAGWPCSITIGKGTQAVPNALPSGSSKDLGWQILLPPSVPVIINAGQRLTDDLGRSYVVNGAELSDLGWRVMASEVHT